MAEEDNIQLNIFTSNRKRKSEVIDEKPHFKTISRAKKIKKSVNSAKMETDQAPNKKVKFRKIDRNDKSGSKPVADVDNKNINKNNNIIIKNKSNNNDNKSNINNKKPNQPKRKFQTHQIFANNPEIPKIACPQVTPTSEDVFSNVSFKKLGLHPFMVSNLARMKMTTLTAVQQKAIPCIVDKKDILVKSQTGSGKTMSYAIPIIEHLQSLEPKISRNDGPYCIVVAPTRELVLQSYKVLMDLVKPFVWVVPGYLMGGEKRKSEKARLKKGMNIIISTPARLVDHLDNTASLALDNVKYLVVDEADRMFDMGFERDVSRIMITMKKKCGGRHVQTILLSATLSPGVEKLAGMSLKQPIRIDMSSHDSSSSTSTSAQLDDVGRLAAASKFATPSSLKHHYVVVPSKLRLVTLASFLLWKCQLSNNPSKVIVFLATQDSVEFHHSLMQTTFMSPDDDDEACKDFELFKLYGDMDQKDRMKIFHEFHAAKSGVLLCTDVASRGLDLPHVEWIVQYNTPGSPTDYIHRVGRTARLGSKGSALLFLDPSEVEYVEVMAREHDIAMHEVKMDNILKTLLLECSAGRLNLIHKGHKPTTLQDGAAFLQAQFEESLSENMQLRTLARKAYQSFIRSYATYPSSLKHIFHIKNLHLGHLATSFALSEAPSTVSRTVGKYCSKQKKISGKFFDSRVKRRDGGVSTNKRDGLPRWIEKKFEDKFNGPRPAKKPKLNFSQMSEFDSGL